MKHPQATSNIFTVEGVAVNDADYTDMRKCPYYAVWHSMIIRCYSPRFLLKNPSYIGCSVHSDWLLFSNFRTWMEKQDWCGKQLDKDIRIFGNKVYGPDTCLFVSKTINGLLNTQKRNRGAYPLGVHPHGNKFKATYKKDRVSTHIGVYTTIAEASTAYQQYKADWIDICAAKESCSFVKSSLLAAADRYRKGSF